MRYESGLPIPSFSPFSGRHPLCGDVALSLRVGEVNGVMESVCQLVEQLHRHDALDGPVKVVVVLSLYDHGIHRDVGLLARAISIGHYSDARLVASLTGVEWRAEKQGPRVLQHAERCQFESEIAAVLAGGTGQLCLHSSQSVVKLHVSTVVLEVGQEVLVEEPHLPALTVRAHVGTHHLLVATGGGVAVVVCQLSSPTQLQPVAM